MFTLISKFLHFLNSTCGKLALISFTGQTLQELQVFNERDMLGFLNTQKLKNPRLWQSISCFNCQKTNEPLLYYWYLGRSAEFKCTQSISIQTHRRYKRSKRLYQPWNSFLWSRLQSRQDCPGKTIPLHASRDSTISNKKKIPRFSTSVLRPHKMKL